MDIKFDWNRSMMEIETETTGGEEGLLFLTQQAERLMYPYVPADKLVLSQNVRVYVKNGKGLIHYLSPYAHYQHEGVLYVDKETKKGAFTDGEGRFWSRPGISKIPSEKKLEYSTFRRPLATSHWEEAMLRDRKEDLIEAYQNYLREGRWTR